MYTLHVGVSGAFPKTRVNLQRGYARPPETAETEPFPNLSPPPPKIKKQAEKRGETAFVFPEGC